VGCLNHNMQHDTKSQKPSYSLTATVTLRTGKYKVGAAFVCPLAKIEGAETHQVSMLS
jgi:hypothetical protein